MKKKPVLSYVLSGAATVLLTFLLFWFSLPPLNLRSPDFWSFVIRVILIGIVCFSFGRIVSALRRYSNGKETPNVADFNPKKWKPLFKTAWFRALLVAAAVFVLTVIGNFAGAEIFHADSYRDLIAISDGDFTEDVAELSMNQIPVVDRDTAERLGQRQLGTIPDLVSQFEVSDDYTQINVNGKPVRVTPLIYADIFKWFNNQASGIPGYISVDMASQDTTLVRMQEGQEIRYSESEILLRNIDRHLRFSYPTKIFGTVMFEVDDNGVPYWIAPCMYYRIALWSGMDVEGAVLVNATTGESQYYAVSDIPQWVDRVYDAELIIEQLNWNGKFQEGFFNAYFGQRNVRRTTDGYNYIANNDDVYLYTGVTSATSDESNIGFVLVNMRTKETHFYTVPGAEEYSAMGSAEGQVQHLNYNATFPLLLNVADRPTYFMSLKDASGLVKMYAFVDVQRYQIVGTGSSVSEARLDYIHKLESSDDVQLEQTSFELSGKIVDVASAVVDGSTQYYLRLDSDSRIFCADISLSPELPFAAAGQTVTLRYIDSETGGLLCTVSSLRFGDAPLPSKDAAPADSEIPSGDKNDSSASAAA